MSLDFNSKLAAEIHQHQQTKEQLHTVLDAMPGTVSWLSSELHYLGVNEQLASLCQMTPEEFVGRPLGFMNPEGNEFTTFVAQFFAGDKHSAQTEITRGSHTYLTIAQKYNHNQAAVFIEIDISDRKAVEAALERANRQLSEANVELAQATIIKDEMLVNMANIHAELTRATRMKDEFLANMSHELRTPLNSILGMSEALLDETCGNLDRRQEKALQTIARSGQHLLELINDILDLAKIESGKLNLQYKTVQVSSLLQSSVELVKQAAAQKRIKIATTIYPTVGAIRLDDRRFRQLLINLLSNAVKFTLADGSVQLSVMPTPDQQRLQFCVVDTGIGIAPEQMQNLFEPFVQIDSRLNRQYSGTGLGLSLVRRIAELHQGSVRVESQVGQGSKFIVEVPWLVGEMTDVAALTTCPGLAIGAHALPEPQVELTAAAPLAPACKRILLAEDNALNTLLFSEYLQDEGYQVVVVQNGEEAVASAVQESLDLIVMDIQMPVMDGLTAIQTLRQQARFRDLPIIALTALAMPGDRHRCLQAGASEYITKPVQLKHLAQRIQHWLNRSQAVRAGD